MVDIDKDELEKTLRVFQKEFYTLKDENDNLIFPVFNTLPLKKEYPDYYEVIKKPVSLNTLKKRVPHYTDPQPFLNDIVQMTWNARIYNAPESIIYAYARIFDTYIRNTVVPKLIKKYPHVVYPNPGPLPEPEDNKIQEDMLAKYGGPPLPTELPNEKDVTQQAQNKEVPNGSDYKGMKTRFRITRMSGQNTDNNGTLQQKQEGKRITHENGSDAIPNPSSLLRKNNKNNDTGSDVSQSYTSTTSSLSSLYQTNEATQLPSLQTQPNRNPDMLQWQFPMIRQVSERSTMSRNRGRSHKLRSPESSPSVTPTNSYPKSIQPKLYTKRGRPPVIDLPYLQRIKNILKNLKRERDLQQKIWITAPFERLPAELQNESIQKQIPNPLCLEDIRKKAKHRKYKDFQSFQNDITQMLTTFKLFYKNDADMLRNVAKLESVYANLARIELAKPDRSFLPEGEVRVPYEDVTVNNITYHIGDWVFIRNPNDAAKPTVGQIFKIWSMPDGTKWFNACWYFRPEQTVHRVDRLFYKNEVMKTGQYRDSLVADLVGKCYVVHFTRYQRGDPDIKLEGPMFICEFRYNETDKAFNKIRTWRACLPEELRDEDEPTIPIGSRKFFKYPSPIRHLLPPNATPNDPIPDPVEGAPGGPPLVGAVYLRPPLKRDDLGEYASSPESPRYIIRPGEPYGEGKIDFEMGTLTVSASAVNKASYYQAKKAHSAEANTGKVHPQIHTGVDTGKFNNLKLNSFTSNLIAGTTTNSMDNIQLDNGITLQTLKQRQLQNMQDQREQQRQQQIKNYTTNHNLTNVINNMSPLASKNALTLIDTNIPDAFTLPIAITKGVETLQHSYGMDRGKQMDRSTPQKRTRGDLVWFKGPSVRIEERFLNMGTSNHPEFSLYDIFPWNQKQPRLDYKEVEEEVIEHARFTRHSKRRDVFEDDAEFKLSDENENKEEIKNISGTYTFGLRPSATFMAHKLKGSEIH